MSKQVRAVVVGAAVMLGLSVLLGFFGVYSSVWFVPFIFGAAVWFILAMLSQNEKVTNLPDAERNALMSQPPPEGYALLYVYREGFMGKAMGVDVLVDNWRMAQLKSPRCVRLVLKPGEHVIAAGPRGFAASQNKLAVLPVALAEGQILTLAIGLQMGAIQNSTTLTPDVDPRAGFARMSVMPMVAPLPVTPPPPPITPIRS